MRPARAARKVLPSPPKRERFSPRVAFYAIALNTAVPGRALRATAVDHGSGRPSSSSVARLPQFNEVLLAT